MKKITIIGLALFIFSSGLLAQKMNNIKTDLFSPFIRTGVLKYERVLNENSSLQIGFFYTGIHPRDTETTLNGYGITPEYRIYLSETPAPSGTYLAPNIRYMSLTGHDPTVDQEATLTSVSLALNLGKQVLLKDVILIDAWVGPLYAFRSVDDPTGEVNIGIPDASGFGLRIGLAIGFAF